MRRGLRPSLSPPSHSNAAGALIPICASHGSVTNQYAEAPPPSARGERTHVLRRETAARFPARKVVKLALLQADRVETSVWESVGPSTLSSITNWGEVAQVEIEHKIKDECEMPFECWRSLCAAGLNKRRHTATVGPLLWRFNQH